MPNYLQTDNKENIADAIGQTTVTVLLNYRLAIDIKNRSQF